MKNKSPWSIRDIFGAIFGIALILFCMAPIIYIFGYSLVKNFVFWIGLVLSIFVLAWIQEQKMEPIGKISLWIVIIGTLVAVYYQTHPVSSTSSYWMEQGGSEFTQ